MEPPSRYFAGVNPQQLFSQQASSLTLQQPLDTPLYANTFEFRASPASFTNSEYINKWLSIRDKQHFLKRPDFSDNNWIPFSIHFWKLYLSTYESNIAQTAFPSDALITFIYFQGINSISISLVNLNKP